MNLTVTRVDFECKWLEDITIDTNTLIQSPLFYFYLRTGILLEHHNFTLSRD